MREQPRISKGLKAQAAGDSGSLIGRRRLFPLLPIWAAAWHGQPFFAQTQTPAASAVGEWVSLFDGKSLTGWRKAGFTGEGAVTVQHGCLHLGLGGPMTGATRLESLPGVKADSRYEVQYEAKRLQGGDFFASLTLPAGGSHCTFVTGGWGGDIVGISSIDGWDASDNETRSYFNFVSDQWYRFRLIVSPEKILAWIDEQQVVNVPIQGRAIALRRGEIDRNVPFGFAAYNTSGAIRSIAYRLLRSGA